MPRSTYVVLPMSRAIPLPKGFRDLTIVPAHQSPRVVRQHFKGILLAPQRSNFVGIP